MSPIDFGSIVVALIAALGAWAAQRASSKATKTNTSVSGRLDAERGAYERARAFDIQTIERQDAEITRLRDANEGLRRELYVVKERVAHLEAITPDFERKIDERIQAEGLDPEQ